MRAFRATDQRRSVAHSSDESEPLAAARGLILALVISMVLWAVLTFLIMAC